METTTQLLAESTRKHNTKPIKFGMSWDWLAGFYEGEGSAMIVGKKYLRLTISQCNFDIINEIREFVGFGTISHHKPKSLAHSEMWEIVFSGRYAWALALKLRPYMRHPSKIKQLEESYAKSNKPGGILPLVRNP